MGRGHLRLVKIRISWAGFDVPIKRQGFIFHSREVRRDKARLNFEWPDLHTRICPNFGLVHSRITSLHTEEAHTQSSRVADRFFVCNFILITPEFPLH